MNINRKQLLFACLLTFIVFILTIFAPQKYQFCTGRCTGNLSNCWCGVITPDAFVSFYMWLAVLLGSAYYYVKAKPSFSALLVGIVFIFIAMSLAYLIVPLILSMLSVTH